MSGVTSATEVSNDDITGAMYSAILAALDSENGVVMLWAPGCGCNVGY